MGAIYGPQKALSHKFALSLAQPEGYAWLSEWRLTSNLGMLEKAQKGKVHILWSP